MKGIATKKPRSVVPPGIFSGVNPAYRNAPIELVLFDDAGNEVQDQWRLRFHESDSDKVSKLAEARDWKALGSLSIPPFIQ